MLQPIQFVSKFIECLKEWRRQLNDTRDEKDAAHFFNPSLKKYIKDHEKELKLLSTINCERGFLKFCNDYMYV